MANRKREYAKGRREKQRARAAASRKKPDTDAAVEAAPKQAAMDKTITKTRERVAKKPETTTPGVTTGTVGGAPTPRPRTRKGSPLVEGAPIPLGGHAGRQARARRYRHGGAVKGRDGLATRGLTKGRAV